MTIADREADFYDSGVPRPLNSELLIMATQNRCLMDSQHHLKEAREAVEPQEELTVEFKRNTTRKARSAFLTLRFTSLTLKPPQNRPKKEQLSPIKLQVILAVEEDPPFPEDPISWLLLTTLPIRNVKDVIRYVQWYSYRWLIEGYHYTLKSGCGVEKLQLKTARRLEMAVATYSIVAWRLLWLTEGERVVIQKLVAQNFFCIMNGGASLCYHPWSTLSLSYSTHFSRSNSLDCTVGRFSLDDSMMVFLASKLFGVG